MKHLLVFTSITD